MSENPYQAPVEEPPEEKAETTKKPEERQLDLKAIIRHQKGVVACINVSLLFLLGLFTSPTEAKLFAIFILMVLGVLAAADVYPLINFLYSKRDAILLNIFTILPVIGLFVLIFTQVKTLRFLKSQGVKVGLFSARLTDT